jgi:hypothetical protein
LAISAESMAEDHPLCEEQNRFSAGRLALALEQRLASRFFPELWRLVFDARGFFAQSAFAR